jgi:hypothetical protein
MGFEPQQLRSTLDSANEFAEHIAQGIKEAKAALTKAKDEHAMFYNRRCEPAPVYAPGDQVWLYGSDIATNRLSSKLSHRRLGPFVVQACIGQGVYRVRGHPSISLLPLSSPTLYLFICNSPHHLRTIFKDHTHSR